MDWEKGQGGIKWPQEVSVSAVITVFVSAHISNLIHLSVLILDFVGALQNCFSCWRRLGLSSEDISKWYSNTTFSTWPDLMLSCSVTSFKYVYLIILRKFQSDPWSFPPGEHPSWISRSLISPSTFVKRKKKRLIISAVFPSTPRWSYTEIAEKKWN